MYNLKESVSIEYFWKHIDQESAMFNMTNQLMGSRFVNRFRQNKSSNTEIIRLGDKVYFWDWGDADFRLNIIQLKMKLRNLSFTDAKEELWDEFISKKRSIKKPQLLIPKKEVEKKQKVYIWARRAWNTYDDIYWGQYDITEQDCINGKLYPVAYFYQKKDDDEGSTVKHNSPDYPIYCWEINNKQKFYLPLLSKKEKRFISTLSIEDMYYLDDYESDTLFIGSSWKDCTVIKKATGFSVRGVQGETSSIPLSLIADLPKFKRIIISFDSDEEGCKANLRYYETISKYHSNVECWYLEETFKDYAEYRQHGKLDLPFRGEIERN